MLSDALYAPRDLLLSLMCPLQAASHVCGCPHLPLLYPSEVPVPISPSVLGALALLPTYSKVPTLQLGQKKSKSWWFGSRGPISKPL